MPNCHKGERYENSAYAHKYCARVEPAERRALCLMQRLRQEEPEEGPRAAEVRHWRDWDRVGRGEGGFREPSDDKFSSEHVRQATCGFFIQGMNEVLLFYSVVFC